MQPTINLNRQEIGIKTYYYIHFKFNRDIYHYFKSLPGSNWDKYERCWFFEAVNIDLNELHRHFGNKVSITEVNYPLKSFEYKRSKLKPSDLLADLDGRRQEAINAFTTYLNTRRYSPRTVDVYKGSLSIFLRYTSPIPLEEIGQDDLIRFNNEYILKNNYSSSFQNQVINAVKLYFRAIQSEKLDVDLIYRPKREKTLPNVLSKEEVKAIITASTNLKHRMLLSLIYACGLRRSELLNLKPHDIHSERRIVLIRQSKGKKDRIVPIGDKLIHQLREYYKLYKPKCYLFEGQVKGEQYSAKSLQNVLKQSVSKSRINKPVTLHWLRHSYATHLLEGGTDLRYIQEILGHSSSRTTEIYTHVSTQNIQNIISPFDTL